jgi:hypothetical protein
MFPRKFIMIAAVALLLLVFVVGVVPNAQREAWTQGYLVGRLSDGAAGASSAQLPAFAYPGYAGPNYGPHFGGLGFIILLILGFFLFTRFFHCMRWRAGQGWGGPEGQGPQGPQADYSGPRRRHGHHAPWWDWDDEPYPGAQPQPQKGGPENPSGESGQA